MSKVTLNDIKKARERITPYIKKTPIVKISKDIFLKLENRQPVVKGFKIRGAANFMTTKKPRKAMTAALGTHGFAVGYIGKILGIRATCMMIKNPPKDAEAKMKKLVGEVIYGADDFASTEKMALAYAKKHKVAFIHPYNDPLVVAGQGTIGLELLEQIPDLKTIYVPIGGGGLIAGVAIAIKSIQPSIRIVGVQPENMHAMVTSVKKKKVVRVEGCSSQAEKIAVNLNPKTITFKIIEQYVDDFITPTEKQIQKAMKDVYLKTGEIVEGAGAIAYAAAKLDKKRKGLSVCVASGGNITDENFKKATGVTLKK